MTRSAIDDDVTARLFELSAQRVRGATQVPLALLLCVGLVVWVPIAELAVAFAACGLVVAWQLLTRTGPSWSRWPSVARRLLTDEAWRELPVTVLDTRGTVLVVGESEHIRVHGLSAAGREVAIRTGRIWAVGPDDGWYAVRVDGLHTPLPARRVGARKAAPATPAGWGRPTRARVDLGFAIAGSAVIIVAALRVGTPWFVALAARQLRRAVRIRDAGPWVRPEATASWVSRQDGLGDGTIDLRFPDGRRCTAHLHRAPLDLFVNAWRGDVVGFPHYPVAAVARLVG